MGAGVIQCAPLEKSSTAILIAASAFSPDILRISGMTSSIAEFKVPILLPPMLPDVSTTKKAKDGGIDGFGRLKLNTIFSVNIAFQCKHYGGKIGAPAIRNFRGSMSPNIEMGLFITTSGFTQLAIDEANRIDQKTIHLMDGEQIVQYLLDYQIGCKKQEVYIIDEDFFKNL